MRRLIYLTAALLSLTACSDEGTPTPPSEDQGADDSFLAGGKADGALGGCAERNILRLLNDGGLDAAGLKAAGVHLRAARNLVAWRLGDDGTPWTGDDHRFRRLRDVDEVPWVGPVALRQLVEAAGEACAQPTFEVVLTDPHCDVCTRADKDWLRAHSPIIQKVVGLIDGATESVDAAQYTFSVKEIERALLRARDRGVKLRVVMDQGQDRRGSVARRLAEAGVDLRFRAGKPTGGRFGLQHAKFMVVDGATLATGSNNWSSTGTTFNEENTLVIRDATLVAAFQCHFEAMYSGDFGAVEACQVPGRVGFTPSSMPAAMITAALRGATTRVDVLMHHLVYDRLLKVLAQAAERGVRVRVVVNAATEPETHGGKWERLRAAGAEIRYKRSNEAAYQLMHDKLVIVDGRILIDGSGNWSGSAFFTNWENFVRYEEPEVVRPFVALFDRLWAWSLPADALAEGVEPSHVQATRPVYFGNLHAHFHAAGGAEDDGKAQIQGPEGEVIPVEAATGAPFQAASYAYDYGRLHGLDFMALTPHVTDEEQVRNVANMSREGFAELREAAKASTTADFLAVAGAEWSTNSLGNHLNVLGSAELAKIPRGRFDLLFEEWLPARVAAGDQPRVMFNHPRTFRKNLDYLTGTWDQIFGVNLQDIPKRGQRNKKFNDFGLDDYLPLAEVRQSWLDGEAMPDEAVVDETLRNIERSAHDYVRLMEVTVSRGTEFGQEVPRNPSLSQDEEGAWSRYAKVHSDLDYFLLHGFRMAPAASHDNHWANWGAGHTTRTAAVMDSLTEPNLMAAIDRREIYATEDEDTDLRFYAGGRVPMGGSLRSLEARVAGELRFEDPTALPDERYTVRLLRGEIGGARVEEVQSFSGVQPKTWQGVALDLPSVGTWFFYLEVHATVADRMSWSAPIWISRLR